VAAPGFQELPTGGNDLLPAELSEVNRPRAPRAKKRSMLPTMRRLAPPKVKT